MKLRRTGWLRLVVVVAALGAAQCGDKESPASPTPTPTPTPVSPNVNGDTLGSAGRAMGKHVGTAVQASLLNTPVYRDIVNREFTDLTAEYEMKWATIGRSRGSPNFAPGDAIVSHAMSQGMQVKAHALVWHSSVPEWAGALPTEDFRTEVEAHIRATASHFRGRVRAWDVVNEAVDGGGLRNSVFLQKLGSTYIAEAFRIAREADPNALLFYNDYGAEGLGTKSDAVYDLVRTLRAEGVPIDGVGLQMHITVGGRPSDADIAANMRRLAALGVKVEITEMDVRISGLGGSTSSRLDAQRAAYQSVVGVCVREPACAGVTFWGFTDAHTWLAPDEPLLFDRNYAPKPAYTGVLDALRGR